MLYSDGVHLVSDEGIQDLHDFAQRLGIKRCWFHASKRGLDHYDIPKRLRKDFLFNCGGYVLYSTNILTTERIP